MSFDKFFSQLIIDNVDTVNSRSIFQEVVVILVVVESLAMFFLKRRQSFRQNFRPNLVVANFQSFHFIQLISAGCNPIMAFVACAFNCISSCPRMQRHFTYWCLPVRGKNWTKRNFQFPGSFIVVHWLSWCNCQPVDSFFYSSWMASLHAFKLSISLSKRRKTLMIMIRVILRIAL